MAFIDPGEFVRGSTAREESRLDREQSCLEELLAAGWSRTTAGEARRLQAAIGDAINRMLERGETVPCDETALGLVGEARGAAMADWWARTRHLDDQTRRVLRDCAAAAAAMAMIDGYMLGRESADEARPARVRPMRVPQAAMTPRVNPDAVLAGVR